ncbi:MAG: asparagine synthase-related protein [Deltaproteobacteria bacterium]|nr:asparagine synthase-related protein [Deltaproteobacteria bacterium]
MIKKLRVILEDSVRRNVSESLLLSGGLDTSILALILKDLGVRFLPVSVFLEGKGKDLEYVTQLSKILKIDPIIVNVKIEEAESAIPQVIKILKSFDPAIPNDLVVYFGMKRLKEEKVTSVITGDGADELFAGYEYMKKIKDLEGYIERISKNLFFNSDPIGEAFGIIVKRPYVDEMVKTYAKEIPKSMKIRKGWGKWILRKAYEKFLPKALIFQDKRPLEIGSGMTFLRDYLASKIEDKEFEEKKRLYGMKFYGKDHLYYFEIYKSIFKEIPQAKIGEIICPNCKGGKKSNHCRICGYVEVL